MKGKWPAPEPESELRSHENHAQEPEPLKFSRLQQLCSSLTFSTKKKRYDHR